ncbi:MAG: hypothetical protein IAE67_08980 [Candidatus Competibacteraceae bacterium]|nr:hypothetical protein [Candidatus Competibacteraceae bacterium]
MVIRISHIISTFLLFASGFTVCAQLSFDETRYNEISTLHAPSFTAEHNRTYFKGNIGKHHTITLELVCVTIWEPGKTVMLYGSYTYEQFPMNIQLEGWQFPDGSVSLKEIVQGHTTGYLTGFLIENQFKGKWTGAKTQSCHDILLEEYKPGGIAQIQTKHIFASNREDHSNIENSSVFDIVYPIIEGVEGATHINHQIEEEIVRLCQSHVKNMTANTLYTDFQSVISPVEGIRSELVASVEMNAGGLISVLFYHSEAEYNSPGSALSLFYHHYRTDNGKRILLEDIIHTDSMNDLSQHVQYAIENKYANHGIEYIKGGFSLSSNFAIMPHGLLFQYNAHEISITLPELPSVYIPYCDIEYMLNTESPAYSFVSKGLF